MVYKSDLFGLIYLLALQGRNTRLMGSSISELNSYDHVDTSFGFKSVIATYDYAILNEMAVCLLVTTSKNKFQKVNSGSIRKRMKNKCHKSIPKAQWK